MINLTKKFNFSFLGISPTLISRKRWHKKFCKLPISQCGNFIICLSVRFYVKSIIGILEVQNLPFYLTHLEDLNFDFCDFFALFEGRNLPTRFRLQSLKNGKTGSFRPFRFSNFDFT